MPSGVLDQLGELVCITGRITFVANVPTISTCNDARVTATDSGPGNCTVNFNEAFISPPAVYMTVSAEGGVDSSRYRNLTLEQITTSLFEYRVHQNRDTGVGLCDVTDFDDAGANQPQDFVVIGRRNN